MAFPPSAHPDAPPGVALLGEALFDSFDGREVPGGAPLNVACHLHGLGVRVLLVTRVGTDEAGRRLLGFLEERGLDLSGVQRDTRHPTGRVVVTRDGNRNSFTILESAAWDFLDLGQMRSAMAAFRPAIVYYGTLALRKPTSREAILRLLAGAGRSLCDLNLRSPWFDETTVRDALMRAEVLKLNSEELKQTALLLGLGGSKDAETALLSRFGIRTLFVTDGERGARRLDRTDDGVERLVLPGSPAGSKVVDTVGAGDAFAAALFLGMLEGWTPRESLARADAFARRVVGFRGALPPDTSFYAPFRSAWSADA